MQIRPPLPVSLTSSVKKFIIQPLIRGQVWESSAHIDRSIYPTYVQVLAHQLIGADADEIDKGEAESAGSELY
ncbi:MAG: hypothetical protein F4227_01510 [Gammaproteobacteria bacterium]|nr:hypothetical protein [Gammaproteobacteria bacterium]MYF01681.1 hypothetical protein [Gammaproteobacteria bacterium]MYI76812.1 hypothetical protein [Gammaproteobacteria bacterium]